MDKIFVLVPQFFLTVSLPKPSNQFPAESHDLPNLPPPIHFSVQSKIVSTIFIKFTQLRNYSKMAIRCRFSVQISTQSYKSYPRQQYPNDKCDKFRNSANKSFSTKNACDWLQLACKQNNGCEVTFFINIHATKPSSGAFKLMIAPITISNPIVRASGCTATLV